ncbi:hypothetical protein [Streptomyces sp. HGB0020]|uniref:hypothetical protein n=1 Tax=Streptomyces sp. HGB0020 TaxID=1078086 RepID=UPI00034E6B5D|nr:hypothetical protein [Streptomyces sp. HGB0020]EPD63180.1 hypothetical protein HMPREF1211_03521 [Streptomyces sp. HGB0020]
MITNFRRNSRGLAEVLKSAEMQAAIGQAGEQVAQQARARLPSRVEVTTQPEVTDRQRVTVLAHGDGQDHAAELIAAARAAGLEVHEHAPTD